MKRSNYVVFAAPKPEEVARVSLRSKADLAEEALLSCIQTLAGPEVANAVKPLVLDLYVESAARDFYEGMHHSKAQ